MDMLPFTDDIHKRSASFSSTCLKSDSTPVRSIAESVIVGRCRTAELLQNGDSGTVFCRVGDGVSTASNVADVTSSSSSLDAVAVVGSVLFTASIRSACVVRATAYSIMLIAL